MPLVWPSLHSMLTAYWPTSSMRLAWTCAGTVAGSSSCFPDVSSIHMAQRQAKRRSRALYLLSWPSGHLKVMFERSNPTISSGIGTSAGLLAGVRAAEEQHEQG